nr:EIN3-binding F-box protein 1-like [Ipomoea batatas]
MSKIFEFSGHNEFFTGVPMYPSSKDSGPFLALHPHANAYFPPCKRARVSTPVVACEGLELKKKTTIEVLPDECLFEVFRRIHDGKERSACACTSKRWLMLLSTLRRDEIFSNKSIQPSEPKEMSDSSMKVDIKSDKNGLVQSTVAESKAAYQDAKVEGYLSRCLDGKKATDVRLAAIAVGTGNHGGLGKLSIRGNNSTRGVTDSGLKAIARGCPSLKALSLWNISSITDEGLCEIANECHLLEKLDLCHCPSITDKSLMAIAKSCPNLTSLTIESCSKIGNESLKAVGACCPNLKFVALKNCPLVGDQGIGSLFSTAGEVLMKVKLQTLNLSDMSLAVIGHYGVALTDLALAGLKNITERGFWVMGNGKGKGKCLQKLRCLSIIDCSGVTDLGIEAMGKGCPNLKQFSLRSCTFPSDNGLVAFAKAAGSLESLQLENCHRITQAGLFGILVHCGGKLKTLALENCMGIKDLAFECPLLSPCNSLRSLWIRNCPGFGDASLGILSKLCPKLVHVDFTGLHCITDDGLLNLVQNCEEGLVKVNLNGCVNVGDIAVSAIAKQHGETLEKLNLDGCGYVTDVSLEAIADHCSVLCELDVSKSRITNSGIVALANAIQLSLQILSLSGCAMVSNKTLPLLLKLGTSLVGLNIQNCPGISSSGVDSLVEKLWRCDVLS